MSSHLNLYPDIGEPIAVLRKRYLMICDNNYCAAMLLDIFYAKAEGEAEWGWIHGEEDHIDAHVYTSINRLTSALFGLFDSLAAHEALMLLLNKKYVQGWYIDAKREKEPLKEDDGIKILCDRKAVEEACEPYYAARRKAQEEEHRHWLAEHPPEPEPEPPSPEELARIEREKILAREVTRVESHLTRAKKAGLPATLTIDEWIAALDYFEWKCAYCGGSYELLEHFVPLSHYGGTTRSNCVPACHGCNGVKQAWHPSRIPYSNAKKSRKVKDGIERVQAYLEAIEGGIAS